MRRFRLSARHIDHRNGMNQSDQDRRELYYIALSRIPPNNSLQQAYRTQNEHDNNDINIKYIYVVCSVLATEQQSQCGNI